MINYYGVRNRELYQRRMQIFLEEVGVYPVSCEQLAGGRSDREWLAGVLAGGAKIVQLRDKESNDQALLEKAHYFRRQCDRAGALFLVNDRVDIALLSGADGVHVGQGDLPPAAIRSIAPDLIIGLSCNSVVDAAALGEEVRNHQCSVSYFNIGPLFPTRTKEGLKEFLGLAGLAECAAQCPLPTTVMGGITVQHVPDMLNAGAQRIAVVTALSMAPDIALETERWQRQIIMGRKPKKEVME